MDSLEEYKMALHLTATVSLPSPFPACGRVYVVAPVKEHGLAAHYIKVVQIVSARQFRAWFVDLEHLRAVRVPADAESKPVAHAGWKLQPAETLKADIEKAIKALAPEKGVREALMYPRAIVIVGESVPVIARYEFVTTAAECDESPRGDFQFGKFSDSHCNQDWPLCVREPPPTCK